MWERRRQRPRAALATGKAPVRGRRLVAHRAPPRARKLITWVALAFITVGSVGNLGSTPPLAALGLASISLYVLPAVLFLLPVSLVAAELASGWPGGVYNWVEQGISAPMGLLAVWCEFAQTIFFYPALLAYIADTLAYVIDPRLAGNGVYTAVIIIVLFWALLAGDLTGVDLRCCALVKCTVIGTPIPWSADHRRSRRCVPVSGEPLSGADDSPSSLACLAGNRQHRLGGKQLLHPRLSKSTPCTSTNSGIQAATIQSPSS